MQLRIKVQYMPAKVKGPAPKRSYDASGRRADSAATRRRILAAARERIVEDGYRTTTVAAIARTAGVNVDTVYALVGRKPVILRELIETAISGRDEAVSAEDRDYVVAIRAEPDPRRKLALYAAALRSIHKRLAPLVLALRDAATTEPEAAEVWRQISDRRAANMRALARNLRDAGGLRDGLTIREAADVLWATNSPDLYALLVMERGWSATRYERWLADSWCRLLLPTDC
jgi:AcrR family transcriptional regulator